MISNDNFWYKNAVFYELYVRAFRDSDANGHGDLAGVVEKLDYLEDLGINCIWLLPIFPSPLKDDGYDVADYYGIHPDYGQLEDFKQLVAEAHKRGIRIITDLVLNHTSDQHPWFQEARKDRASKYRDYYVWSDDPSLYSEARIIFLDTEESNWTWDEEAGQYFWHRFFSSQPDLNYENPAVQDEMIAVIKFWLDLGIDGFRADAIPYLFEDEGTNCENLPQTHDFIKRVRKFMDDNYPGRILLSEANQWPEDVRPYFGDGDEVHMAFHFPVMPRIFMALKQEDITPVKAILERTPAIPENTQWCIFLRNHDELTLEMVTEPERQWMWEQYAPEDRMRLNLGIRRRLAPLLNNNAKKIALANSILFTLPGSPIVYYGDEIGMGDNIWLNDRDGVRTPMQWDASPNGGFSSAESVYAHAIQEPPYGVETVNVAAASQDPDSIYHVIKRMIRVHKNNKALGWGDFAWARSTQADKVSAYLRIYDGQVLLILHNLTRLEQNISVELPPEASMETPIDLLSELPKGSVENQRLTIEVPPLGYYWLKLL